MIVISNLATALSALAHNKTRSGLTMLGIIIGVAAVVTLMSVGQGTQDQILAQFQTLGPNLLIVTSGPTTAGRVTGGFGSASTLTLADANALANRDVLPDVFLVAPELDTRGQAIVGNQNLSVQVAGVTPEYQYVRAWDVAEGQFITQQDVDTKALVCVLGSTVAQTLFGSDSPVGQEMRLNGLQFRITGLLQTKGGGQDQSIFAPLSTVQTRLSSVRGRGGEPVVSSINIEAASSDATTLATQEITLVLDSRHKIGANQTSDFNITSLQQVLQSIQQATQLLTFFLGFVAGISLLVGGIGIMNIMLVSVTERIREIGIRKAVGAKRRDILGQFLIEAAAVSILGGAIGVGLGYLAAHYLSGVSFGGSAIQAVVSPNIVILAVSVSTAIGLVFGIYPAARASSLDPIQALRHE